MEPSCPRIAVRRTASLPLAYVEERRRFRSPMPKNGVASARLSAGIRVLIPRQNKDVDGWNPSPPRPRRGHDLTRPAEAQAKAASPAMTVNRALAARYFPPMSEA